MGRQVPRRKHTYWSLCMVFGLHPSFWTHCSILEFMMTMSYLPAFEPGDIGTVSNLENYSYVSHTASNKIYAHTLLGDEACLVKKDFIHSLDSVILSQWTSFESNLQRFPLQCPRNIVPNGLTWHDSKWLDLTHLIDSSIRSECFEASLASWEKQNLKKIEK